VDHAVLKKGGGESLIMLPWRTLPLC